MAKIISIDEAIDKIENAMTLMIGIIASVFTAVVITQLYLDIIAESKLATMRNFAVKEAK